MGLILSKYLPVFMLPLGLALTVLIICLGRLWWPGARRWVTGFLLFFCLLILWMAGSPYFSDWLLTSLEGRYVAQETAVYPGADAIVVLGGGVAGQQVGGRKALPGRAFDRLYLGCRLYLAEKAPVMVLSGGGIDWRRKPGASSEARLMAALARQLGLPEEALISESHSRNTRENAWFTRETLYGGKRGGTVLLVTSAFHMPRAQACFEQLGMTVIPCPADFRVDPYKTISALDFLPDAGALDDTTNALREYMGMVYYRLRGWL